MPSMQSNWVWNPKVWGLIPCEYSEFFPLSHACEKTKKLLSLFFYWAKKLPSLLLLIIYKTWCYRNCWFQQYACPIWTSQWALVTIESLWLSRRALQHRIWSSSWDSVFCLSSPMLMTRPKKHLWKQSSQLWMLPSYW